VVLKIKHIYIVQLLILTPKMFDHLDHLGMFSARVKQKEWTVKQRHWCIWGSTLNIHKVCNQVCACIHC